MNGVAHIGNMSDPQIPSALSPVVVGIKSLHNFFPQPLHHLGNKVTLDRESGKWKPIALAGSSPSVLTKSAFPKKGPRPEFGINSPATSNNLANLEEDVTPYDFATIYNVLPLWNAGIDGTGQTIAIAGTSAIDIGQSIAGSNGQNDVATFRAAFGLPTGNAANTPKLQSGNSNPLTVCTDTTGKVPFSTNSCEMGDLFENSLDVEWSGAVAKNAQVILVSSYPTSATDDGLFDSESYIVNNLTARIMSVSYGGCELGNGTAGNVEYYNLWQTAASEGIAVFVATGDSGSPGCDQGGDSYYGNPYSAQYGLTVNGLASTPYDTAVGGTDFSWCKPVYNSAGNAINGCPSSSSSQGTPAYWNTSNSTTTGESAAGYVPEIPWNDTCMNPIQAAFLESLAPLVAQGTGAATPTSPEGACNFVQNNWSAIYNDYQGYMIAQLVDTVGGGGGASNCVVNNGSAVSSCTATTVATNSGTVTLVNDGWPKPSWQTGVTGIPADGVRDIPDVSFFAGDGTLDSATLVCVSAAGSCVTSSTVSTNPVTTEPIAQEVGGTSVATPEMAGVMALINQHSGAPQGNPNLQLYQLAGRQTYSGCSAESVSTSTSCFFNDIDQGTNAMPCDYGAYIGGTAYNGTGWVPTQEVAGTLSPNCKAVNSGDMVGTLVTSSGAEAYNAATGFDLATGLGSMNVANVVNAWVSDAGTNATTMTVQPTPSTITINQAMSVVVSVTGSGGTPTGTITLIVGNFSATETIGKSPCTSNTNCSFSIPANSLAPGSNILLNVNYNGDSTFATNSKTTTVNVNVMTPTVGLSAPSTGNVANAINVTVTASGPSGSVATPSGTVYLKSGSYTSTTSSLTNGSAVITIPANSLTVGTDTLTADYSGDTNYAGNTGTTQITMSQTVTLTPTISVTPTPSSIDTGQTLTVTASVTGAGPTPTGTIYVKSGSYTSSTETIGTSPCTSNANCGFTVPVNSLGAGTDTLTAYYSGDTNYASGTGTGNVTVTQSAYALTGSTPTAVAPGSSTTSTITGQASTTNYSGTVTLNTCSLTSSPSGAVSLPSCTVSGTVTYSSGTASGSGTATVFTTAASTAMIQPNSGKGWLGTGSGAVLALLIFLGVPARRKSWRAMLGALAVLAVLCGMSACGGGGSSSGGGGTSISATTAGSYTFTVSGKGSDPSATAGTGTFTVTVN